MTFIQRIKEQDREKAKTLYLKLRSIKAVARVMKRNWVTVWRWLKGDEKVKL